MSTRNRPRIVGLTGPIGGGKSTVAGILEREYRVPVYYADDRAKELMTRDAGLREKIIALFGPGSYQGENLNRTYLGQKVFADPAALKRLEAVVHPAVREDFDRWVREQQAPYVVLENAVLEKSGMDRLCDAIVYVTARPHIRLDRIRRRNPDWSEAHIRQRMQAQSQETTNSKSQKIILENSDNLKELRRKIAELHRKLLSV